MIKENTASDVITADVIQGWTYEVCPSLTAKVQLLTVGGTSTTGRWRGELGEHFLAWAPHLKRDKEREEEILADRAKLKKYVCTKDGISSLVRAKNSSEAQRKGSVLFLGHPDGWVHVEKAK